MSLLRAVKSVRDLYMSLKFESLVVALALRMKSFFPVIHACLFTRLWHCIVRCVSTNVHVFVPPPAISRRRHSVFRQSVKQRECVRDRPTKRLYDILQTACGNFTKFTTSVKFGTKMNRLDFEQGHSETKGTLPWPSKHFTLVARRIFPNSCNTTNPRGLYAHPVLVSVQSPVTI